MTATLVPSKQRTVADLVRELGDLPLDRIRLQPPPGTATIDDLLRTSHCELIDGTLVEKAMGMRESLVAAAIIHLLRAFVLPRNLGMVTGPDGTMEVLTGLVRVPDVAFISWDRFPDRRIPEEPVPSLAPNLAVEVISTGNTVGEMARKRREYFTAGVVLVWMVDRFTRTVAVYTSPTDFRTLTEADTLDGGTVLPGLALSIRDLFAELNRHG